MSGLSEGFERFRHIVRERNRDVFLGMANEVTRSVVTGSEITGSDGQPVDTGALRSSWIPEYVTPDLFQLTTNVSYARAVEDGVGRNGQPVTYGKGGARKTEIGGSHSVQKTIDGIDKIQERVVRQVTGGEP